MQLRDPLYLLAAEGDLLAAEGLVPAEPTTGSLEPAGADGPLAQDGDYDYDLDFDDDEDDDDFEDEWF